ncbi:mucin-7 [Amia ocellicauda]|uniref:mucin-7 n=1 Tax=Amia ocellicauda TaxID=2972642 RepID=UPI003463D35E
MKGRMQCVLFLVSALTAVQVKTEATTIAPVATLMNFEGSGSEQPTVTATTPRPTNTAAPTTVALTYTTIATPTTFSTTTASTLSLPGSSSDTTFPPLTPTQTSVPEGIVSMKITIKRTFTSSLKDPTSPSYKALEANVSGELNPFYAKIYPAFRHIQILNFTNGSIDVDFNLVFDNVSSVPIINSTSNNLQSGLRDSQVFLDVDPATVIDTRAEPTTAAPTTTTTAAPTTTTTAAPTTTKTTSGGGSTHSAPVSFTLTALLLCLSALYSTGAQCLL